MRDMAEFSLPLRVYIEDTDAGGIVFYVNYLKYMERARTDFMRSLGFPRSDIFNEERMFVVSEAALKFHQPARLDDELEATAALEQVRGVSLRLRQCVRRGSEMLVDGAITIACVDPATLKPRRIPATMLATLRGACVSPENTG